MAKRARKPKVMTPQIVVKMDGPTPEQHRHAIYEHKEILHAETFTRAMVHRIRQQSSLLKMYEDGNLTAEQFYAAQQIAHVAEMIQRNASVRCASLEARVDHSGSARDILIERLGMVRAEAAYTRWRTRIAVPRRMIVDMVMDDRSLYATARTYRIGWPRAKRLLRNALDMWIEIMDRVVKEIDEDRLDHAHRTACA